MPPALADMLGTKGVPVVHKVACTASAGLPAQLSKRPRVELEAGTQVDHSALFSEEGAARKMARLRVLVTSFAGKEGVIGLHGGLPPASAFPITEMALTLRDGTRIVIDDPAKARCRASLTPQDIALVRLSVQPSLGPCSAGCESPLCCTFSFSWL